MAYHRKPWFARRGQNEPAELLRQDHKEIRGALARAVKQRGPIGEAAERLSGVCLPHFELEERIVLPMLAELHDLVSGNNAHPTLMDLQAQVGKFRREERRFKPVHQTIVSAGEVFLQAAYKEGNEEFTALGHLVRDHERAEEEVGFAAYELGLLGNSRI